MSTVVKKNKSTVEKMRKITPHVEPQVEVERKRVVKRVSTQKKKDLYSLKNIALVSCMGIFLISFGQLHLDSKISKIHYEIQQISLEIANETVKNEQLASGIADMSMYSRVVEIAQENGLDYHDNIISIDR